MRLAKTQLLTAMLCLTLGACATTPHSISETSTQTESPSQKKATHKVQVPLSDLSTDFLYLAAEDAIQENRIELATRFLETLIRKDSDAAVPRIQLAGLLLRQGQNEAALKQIGTALQQGKRLQPRIAENAHLLYARILASTGHEKEAIQQLDELLAQNPGRLHVRVMEARLLAKTSNFDMARAIIEEGLKRHDSPILRQVEAEIDIAQNRLKDAEKALKRMQALAPDSETAVLMLSHLATRQHDTVRAEYTLRKFLANHPGSLRIGNALGRLMVQENRPKEAIKIYQGIARQTGNNPAVLSTLGLLYYQQKMYKQAIDSFEQILDDNPDAPVRFYLAASLEAGGQVDRAARIYGQIGSDEQDYPSAQLQLGGIEFRRKKPAEAAARLTQLIAAYPTYADAYNMLSSVRASQKKYKLLLKETEAALDLNKVDDNLLFNRAVAFEGLKRYDDSEASLRRVLSHNPNHAEALNFLGYMYAERGVKLDEAESLIERALEQRPKDGYYMDSLAWVYYKKGDYARALKVQQKAVAEVPDDATMQEHMGDILWRRGMAAKAKKAWSDSLKLTDDDKARARLKQKLAKGI